MAKLSPAQQKIMDKATKEIDNARECATFEEYFINHLAWRFNGRYNTPEKMKANDKEGWDLHNKYYEKLKVGITLTMCNSKSLAKLEQFGLIEIIFDSTGQTTGIDEIKVLNY